VAEGVGTKSADQVRHHARQLKRWKGPPHPEDHMDEHSDHHSDHSEHGGPPEPGAPPPRARALARTPWRATGARQAGWRRGAAAASLTQNGSKHEENKGAGAPPRTPADKKDAAAAPPPETPETKPAPALDLSAIAAAVSRRALPPSCPPFLPY